MHTTKTIILSLLLFLCTSLQARDLTTEFRSVWVITWEHINAAKSSQENMATIRRILDDVQRANMNAVLWQVRQEGTAYYRSPYEPWGQYAGYHDPGYDPLAYAVQEAHKRGLEIHAWFNVFFASNTETAGAPAAAHPEWICRNQEGQPISFAITLSPGLKPVRDYTLAVAMDIVRRYDLDGLHLDYIRWNDVTGGANLHKAEPQLPSLDGFISEEQQQALTANNASNYFYDVEHPYSAGVPAGFSAWEEWRRWSVTEFVRTLHDSIQTAKPWVRLSAAALGRYDWGLWNGYYHVYQDAALWFNQGYVDQLMPMHYHWKSGAEFLDMLTSGCLNCWSASIQPGIQSGRLYSVGPPSYTLSNEKIMDRHPGIVAACRQVDWVDGFQFFSYGSWKDHDYFATAATSFFPTLTKIRAAKFLHDTVPASPSLQLIKSDSLHYRLAVQPAAAGSADQWYLVYRQPLGGADPAQIIDRHFGHEPYEVLDYFSGIQDFNGSYSYFATACDRFWNESVATAALRSDAIPSFAPVLASSAPAPGDTIDSKAAIILRFTKTMDVTSFQNALSLQPATALGPLQWSADKKTCTIRPAEPFIFAASYTLHLAASVKDINGRLLDGNGDGQSGDPWSLAFCITARDLRGPSLLAQYPAEQGQMMPEEVLSFVFDEPLSGPSLTETSLALKNEQERLACAWTTAAVQDKTVLTVQPLTPLDLNSRYQIELTGGVTDTLGNALAAPLINSFSTTGKRVASTKAIDPFVGIGNWKAATYSGSNQGILAAGCLFEQAKEVYLPNNPARWRNSAGLAYAWDPSASAFLLRHYMDVNSTSGMVKFDSTYTLQCFVFGDGSATKLRFALDDGTQHEVSQWIEVDWYGWRLVEWPLSDRAFAGTWLGDGVLNSSQLNFDSIQLTRSDFSAWSGKLYFDELRVVKKTQVPTLIASGPAPVQSFSLLQNYPNPFNGETVFRFSLAQQEKVQLIIYDLLGRQVAMPVSAVLPAGLYERKWDSHGAASGVYWYVLQTPSQRVQKKMTLAR